MFDKELLETVRTYCKDDEAFEHMLQLLAETEAKRQAVLFDPNARFHRIFQYSPDAMTLTTVNEGILLEVNHGFEAISGYTADEVLGKTTRMFWKHPEQRAATIEQLQETGFIQNAELEFLRKNGEVFLALMSAEIIDLDGQPCIITVLRDMTQFLHTKSRLEASEQRYRRIVEVQSEAICRYNPDDLRFTFVNAAYNRCFGGYDSPEAMIGTPLLARFPDESRESVRAYIQTLMEQGEVRTYERPSQHADGEWRWYEWTDTPIVDESGRVVEIQAVGRDMTERKNAQTQLHLLLKSMPHTTMILFDTNLRSTVVVGKGLERMGLAADALEGQPLEAILPPDQQSILEPMLQNLLQGQEQTIEYTYKQYTCLARFYPLQHGEQVEAGLAIIEDISKRVQEAQQRIELAIERQRVEVVADFIDKATHEFRTPLSVIESSLYLAQRSPDEEKQQQAIERARHSAQGIGKLVDGLITMARLDTTGELRKSPINPNQAVRFALSEMERRAVDKGVQLETALQPNLPSIHGSYLELVQALDCLLDNALKFTEEGGTIRIETSHEDDAVCIRIADTGIGIPQHALPHIFERFYRLDTAHSTPGFGLGLPIVQSIVARHGGAVTVDSVLGVGSTFQITLPMD